MDESKTLEYWLGHPNVVKAYQALDRNLTTRFEETVALCILSEEGAAKINFDLYVMFGDHEQWGRHFNWSHNFAASILRKWLDAQLKAKHRDGI